METLEYRKLIMMLDGQIADAKKAGEEKARREGLEQHLKLIKHQVESIETRKAELEKLGVKTPIDLGKVLAQLALEKETLEKQLVQPESPKPPARMSAEDRTEVETLYEEIMKMPVDQLEPDESWVQFEIWGIRWRIVAERVGEDVADGDGFLKMCFARIRERMAAVKEQGYFIEALERSSKGDWAVRLKVAEERLGKLIEERLHADEAERAAEQALQDVVTQMKLFKDAGPDANDRLLRHHARNAAKYEHLREELAEMLLPAREILGEEMAFLWKNGQEPEEKPAEPRKMTNQEIVTRILRRMNSKRLIGACHGPWDRIYHGFPEHDKGRAKDALDVLTKGGILRKKSTLIGFRVSIEPKMLHYVQAAIASRPMGISVVDEWCAKQEG
jgi:hypothetical protein